METEEFIQLVFERREIVKQQLYSEDFVVQNIIEDTKVEVIDLMLESGYMSIVHSFRPFPVVLQENKEIASYPATLWDHIKKTLRLPYKKKVIKLTEYAAFPQMKYPEKLGEARMYYEHNISNE